MYPVVLLIKPCSEKCNFKCKYCFYEDISNNRQEKSYGFMTLQTLEQIVKKALQFSVQRCSFIFQGGEPTLIGLDFYKKLIQYVKKYNAKNLEINYSIQTNGYLLNREWAEFFYQNKFLIGISLDGTKNINDCNRIYAENLGTYDIILDRINLLRRHNVEFNILTVITSQVAKNIKEIYCFYKEQGLKYQQYIPCLDKIDLKEGLQEHSLIPNLYARFLCDLFDLWYDDISKGEFIYNRYFENIVGIIKGYYPEDCSMVGHCFVQNIVEADGSVYPCDFYVTEKYKIGNLVQDDFLDIEKNRKNIKFIENSLKVEEECLKCEWKNICRGGCRRYRDNNLDGKITLNYYCSSYKIFFKYSIHRFIKL